MVTKNDYRFLHTLEDMGPAPEPNLTVLYSSKLPENFKKYAANISVTTSSIQYENDDVMRPVWGDDYSICCCVSATETGKEMQFFGARANLAKCLLYAINGGVDEKLKTQVGPEYKPITSEYLDYDEVMQKYDQMMDWLAHLYVGTLNMIHYMHDKYYYEAAEMALIDTKVERSFATGIAGFSHVVDSLSAIKYAKVKAIRDEDGITTDFQVEGDFPRYGNDDDRADEIARNLLSTFMDKLKHIHTYRDSKPTTSILTITSNVVYGKATGALPDGRKAGEPLAPGANPSYGAEQNGLLASLNSVAKLDYEDALDGISNTQTINPEALGHSDEERTDNLVHVLDGYFNQGAHHLNVNVFGKEKLIDAMEHPEKEEYANFTIRVSGYAVKFIKMKKTMDTLVPGERVEIVATDPGFSRDAAAWCNSTGNKFISKDSTGGKSVVVIEKGEPQACNLTTTCDSKGKTLIMFSDDLDKALATFVLANGAAATGQKVTIFFTFWGLNVIKKLHKPKVEKDIFGKMFGTMLPSSSLKLKLSKMSMGGMGGKMMRYIMHRKGIDSLESLRQQALENGVEFIACQMSMDVMGVKREELLDEVTVGGVATYMERADNANINLFI